MIDKAIFAEGMGQLGGAFGREIDGPVSKMYYGILSKRLTTEQFAAAVTKTLDTETFWPSPAVILGKVISAPEKDAQHAFEKVNNTLKLHGGFRFLPNEIAKQWDQATWAGIKAVGGLMQITTCTTERWDALQRRFRNAYLEALNPPPALPAGEKPDPRVKQLVASTALAMRTTTPQGGQDNALPRGDRE